MKRWTAVSLAVLACLVLASVATGAGTHFTKQGVPVCDDTGTNLTCTGELVGLGNQDLVIDLRSDALATFECGAPGNNNIAAGQNKIPFTATGGSVIPGSAIKNGRASFSVTGPSSVPDPSPKEAGCPNNNWHVNRVIDIDFANVRLTISQAPDFSVTCTFPGEVPEGPKVTLSC
jgi:hypothetical protein